MVTYEGAACLEQPGNVFQEPNPSSTPFQTLPALTLDQCNWMARQRETKRFEPHAEGQSCRSGHTQAPVPHHLRALSAKPFWVRTEIKRFEAKSTCRQTCLTFGLGPNPLGFGCLATSFHQFDWWPVNPVRLCEAVFTLMTCRRLFDLAASKFITESNGRIFDVSPENKHASPNVKTTRLLHSVWFFLARLFEERTTGFSW